MSGNGLVVDERAQAELRHPLGPQRHLKHGGTRAVERRARVACGGVRFAEAREGLRHHRCFRAHVELKNATRLLRFVHHAVDVAP